LEINGVVTIHDDMHRAPITTIKPSRNGQWLVTGCMDSTVRVWKHEKKRLELKATLCGHTGGEITCIDISTTFGTIVTGGADGSVLVWDLRTLSFLRCLDHTTTTTNHDNGSNSNFAIKSVTSVSLNDKTGDIVTLIGSDITIFDINGNVVARQNSDVKFTESSIPSCAISTDCPEWMVHGIVAVSGHKNGDIRLWGIDRDEELLVFRLFVNTKVHFCPITCLRLEGKRQDTLLAGDVSGKMSMSKSLQLDSLNQNDFAKFMTS
jgi:WD40 repeat protein